MARSTADNFESDLVVLLWQKLDLAFEQFQQDKNNEQWRDNCLLVSDFISEITGQSLKSIKRTALQRWEASRA